MRLDVFGLVLQTLLGGCVHSYPGERAEFDVIGQEATTYQGEIPCADCPGQRFTLTLFADRTFRLRHTYLGRDETFHDLGRWGRAQGDGHRIRLAGGTEAQRQFAILGSDTLRMLDSEGSEIRSVLNHDLIEGRFVAVLDATASARVVGDSLELRDQEANVRMRLEARYLH